MMINQYIPYTSAGNNWKLEIIGNFKKIMVINYLTTKPS
jgi:hypothetical protein